MLFISGLIAFLSTLPIFVPANVFRQTQSRLGTTGGVLLTRLAALRPLTAADERLRAVLDSGGMDARLLYAKYGPRVLMECTLAQAGDLGAQQGFLIYALPGMLAPHLLHLVALGVATSALLSGAEGARWRVVATLAGLAVAVAEVAFVATYDDRHNMRSTRVNDVDFVFWKLQVWRGLLIAATDAGLGWVVWLQATGRAFLSAPAAGERVLDHVKVLEGLLGKVRALGVIRNGTVRDASLRRKLDTYWVKESEVMRDTMEQQEVLEAQRNALRRLDTTQLGREANEFIDAVLGLTPAPGSNT